MERRDRSRGAPGSSRPRPSEADRLELEPGQDVVVIERVRTADGRAGGALAGRARRSAWWRVATTWSSGDASSGSVYEVLERDLGIVIHHGVASFRPVRADRSRGRPARRPPRRAAAVPAAGGLRRGRHARSSPRTSTTWPTRSSSRWSGGVPEGGSRDDADVGKAMRLKRVIDPAGVSIICALDHGMTSPTFLEPLADIAARTAETVAGGANVIMMSKGMIRIAEPAFSPTTSLALLLSASAEPGGTRPEIVQIAEVEEAVRLGADAVVLFTALGGDREAGMIRTLAAVGRGVRDGMGMPFIAEAEFPTTYASVEELKAQYGFEYLRPQRPPVRRAGRRHREDELARRRRLVREAGRGGERHPRGAGRRVAAGGPRAAVADGAGHRRRRHRLLGGPQHLHARVARGHHPGALARHPRTVVGRQGARRAAGRARPRGARRESRVHDRA